MTVLTIAGSPSANSRSSQLLGRIRSVLTDAGVANRALELRSLPAAPLLQADVRHPAIAAALEAVADASVVILATPVYKAAYSGLLKSFLDLLPQNGFEGKYVWPLATGGSLAHALVIDYALRPVLGALGPAHVARGVFAIDSEIDPAASGAALSASLQARLAEGSRALQAYLATLEPRAVPLPAPAFLRSEALLGST